MTKFCVRCCGDLPVTEFSRHKSTKDGYDSWCKGCRRDYYNGRRKNSPETARKADLKKYGITPEDYDRLLKEQDGKCAICKTPEALALVGRFKYLHVDHDHTTGKVRGLLCHPCNVMLGMAKDSIVTLSEAVTYLARSG